MNMAYQSLQAIFLKNEKTIKNQNLDVDNPLFDVFTASLNDFFVAISQIRK